jgi:hypothetical protein
VVEEGRGRWHEGDCTRAHLLKYFLEFHHLGSKGI